MTAILPNTTPVPTHSGSIHSAIQVREIDRNMLKIFERFNEIQSRMSSKMTQIYKGAINLKVGEKLNIPNQTLKPFVLEAIAEVEQGHPHERSEVATAAKVARLMFDSNCSISLTRRNDNVFELNIGIYQELQRLFSEKFIFLPTELQARSCYYYALLIAGENMEGSKAYFNDTDLPELLEKWEYEVVTTRQPGDLILFFNEGKPTHLGLCRENGLIESKWGNMTPHACLHTIEMAPAEYGRQIRFYRKKLAAQFQELGEQQKSIAKGHREISSANLPEARAMAASCSAALERMKKQPFLIALQTREKLAIFQDDLECLEIRLRLAARRVNPSKKSVIS